MPFGFGLDLIEAHARRGLGTVQQYDIVMKLKSDRIVLALLVVGEDEREPPQCLIVEAFLGNGAAALPLRSLNEPIRE